MKIVLFLVCLYPLFSFAGASYPPVDVEMTVRQVGPHSYYVRGGAGAATENKGFISNAGFVVTNTGVVVIDALGSPSLASLLRERIREITPLPVVKVILTHYHADHIYGLQVFREEGAEIIAPEGAWDYIDSEGAKLRLEERRISLFPWVDENTRVVPPDRLITRSTDLEVGGIALRLDYLGKAHSDGDLTVYIPDDRVLYSGDIIFEGRVPFVGDADSAYWLETLSRLETDGIAALVPGHGPAARKPANAIALTRRYLSRLREVMGAAVEELQDFDEAYESADWSEFSRLPAFAATHRRNAYQVYLAMEAEGLGE